MKLSNRTQVVSIVIVSGTAALAAAPYGDYGHAGHHVDDMSRTLALSPAVAVADPYLPALADAKNLLNTMSRHREWVEVETASGTVFAFVVYPDRSDPGPFYLHRPVFACHCNLRNLHLDRMADGPAPDSGGSGRDPHPGLGRVHSG